MQNWFSHVILKKCTSWNIIFDIDENKMKLFLLFYSNLSAFIIFQMENLEMRWVEGFKYSHFGSTCSCTQNMQCRKRSLIMLEEIKHLTCDEYIAYMELSEEQNSVTRADWFWWPHETCLEHCNFRSSLV